MPSDFHFRFATCLTLVLACAGLGYSEWDLVAGVTLVTVLVISLIIAAFVWDRRLTLGLKASNLFGAGIALATVMWVATEVSQREDGFAALLLQPGLLLPYVGPFLMVLIPAKLLRPKHLGDWWTMQGIGLAAIALGASMSETGPFAAILSVYMVSAMWSISLLYLRSAAGQIPPMPTKIAPPEPMLNAPERAFHVWPLARFIAGSLAFCSIVGIAAFLLVPRATAEKWSFGKARMETGFTLENSHDINKIGDLNINRDLALRIVATNADGTKKTDLDPDALWRGVSYSDYEDGKWVRRSFPTSPSATIRTGRLPLDAPPPDLGPGAYQLEFQPEENSPGTVVYSPVTWKIGGEIPVRSLGRTEQSPWLQLYDGSFAPESLNRRWYAYRQWVRPLHEPGLGEGFELSENMQFPRARSVLTAMRVPSIRTWAQERLRRFTREGKIPPAATANADTRTGFDVPPEHYESVARAFAEEFRNAAEFTYTLKLRRQDRRLDPIEDFLTYTKAGHCQWFASALCLALRSVGVPAQFVMGYKGQESLGDGSYSVRQENAHAWVEVLIPRTAPAGFPYEDPETARGGIIWHWLSLDPTPAGNATAANSDWFDTTNWQTAISSLVEFVLNYDAERRNSVAEAAPRRLLALAGMIAALGISAWVIRFLRRWISSRKRLSDSAISAVSLPWYQDLIRVLDRGGIRSEPGQTPKEFAEAAKTILEPEHPEVAAIPVFVTSKLYRVRFAGIGLTDEEWAEVSSAIRELETRLSQKKV